MLKNKQIHLVDYPNLPNIYLEVLSLVSCHYKTTKTTSLCLWSHLNKLLELFIYLSEIYIADFDGPETLKALSDYVYFFNIFYLVH